MQDQQVLLQVDDTGIGIAAEHLSHLGEPVFTGRQKPANSEVSSVAQDAGTALVVGAALAVGITNLLLSFLTLLVCSRIPI